MSKKETQRLEEKVFSLRHTLFSRYLVGKKLDEKRGSWNKYLSTFRGERGMEIPVGQLSTYLETLGEWERSKKNLKQRSQELTAEAKEQLAEIISETQEIVGEGWLLASLPTLTFSDPWGTEDIRLSFNAEDTATITYVDGTDINTRHQHMVELD